MVSEKLDQLRTVPEAASVMKMSAKTLWKYVHGRQIGSVKIGRSRRIPDSAIRELIERGSVPAVESR